MKTLTALLLFVATTVAAQGPPPPPPPPPPVAGASPGRDVPYLPPIGSGVISGKVVTTDQQPQPIRTAVVILRTDSFRTGWTFVTDAAGTFTFNQLPPGRFTLSVSRLGFPSVNYGARRPGRPGASIVLKEGGSMANVVMTMPRGAVISGRVLDDHGAPVSNARIACNTVVMRNGERTLGGGGFDSTDDRGEYRIFGLAAGDYIVSIDNRFGFQGVGQVRYSSQDFDAVLKGGSEAARPGQAPPAPPRGQELAQTSTYYPSVSSIADASLVHVNAGEERPNTDIQMRYVPAASVSGVLLDAEGKVPAGVIMNLVQIGVRNGPANFGRPAPADGSFTFPGLTPGRYAITARATTPATATSGSMPPLWARADVDVNGTAISGVRMTLQPGASITGSVTFETSTGTAAITTSRVGLIPVLSGGDIAIGVGTATMERDRTFSFTGVPPGRYRVDPQSSNQPLPATARWVLKSAILNGQDVLDDAFEVSASDVQGLTLTYSDAITEINGSLEDATGRPAPDYYIIVFPTDQKSWFQNSRRIKTARPGLDGKYVIRGLPAGTYRIGAVTDVENGDWFESWFLQQLLPASAEITLGDGEKKIFPLKIGG